MPANDTKPVDLTSLLFPEAQLSWIERQSEPRPARKGAPRERYAWAADLLDKLDDAG